MSWFFWAILSSVAAAVLAELNRVFKQEPQLLNAWRSTIAFILLGAALPMMEFPNFDAHKNFYVVAAVDGAVMAIGMILFFQLAQQKSGRVTSMILPMSAVATYLSWWVLSPSDRPDLVDEPARVLIAVFSLVMITLAMQKIRANDNSWESFLIILPVGFAFGVIDALTKYVMGEGFDVYALSLSYTFLASFFCAAVAWFAAIKTPDGGRVVGFFDKNLLWAGFWAGFWTALMFLASTFAVALAPNPAYAGIFLAITPIWLFLYNHFRGVHDVTSPVASLLILLGAVGLLFSSI